MKKIFFTITGLNFYYGDDFLKKGMKVKLDIKCFYPSTNANFSHFHYFFTVEDGVSSDDIFTKKDTGYRFYHTSDIVSNYIYINRIIDP